MPGPRSAAWRIAKRRVEAELSDEEFVFLEHITQSLFAFAHNGEGEEVVRAITYDKYLRPRVLNLLEGDDMCTDKLAAAIEKARGWLYEKYAHLLVRFENGAGI